MTKKFCGCERGGGRKVCVLVYHSSMGRGWFREQGVKMHPGFNIQYSIFKFSALVTRVSSLEHRK